MKTRERHRLKENDLAHSITVAREYLEPRAKQLSMAALGLVAMPEAGTAMVQEAGYYKRRWRYRDGAYVRAPFAEVDTYHDTWVAAPFARVYSGRGGTWVRAPFVNLWVPR